MPKVDFIQNSFASGEIGPDLYGRTDIAQYQNACKIVENFLIRSYGPAISTPGTKYIGTVSNSTLKCRLIKFIFNRTDAFVIEFGPLYFRFYTNQGIVCTTGTTPFQLAHTFLESELDAVQFTQLNDVIWLTHPAHPPNKLIRKSAANWQFVNFDFKGGPFLDEFVVTTSTIGITSATITLTPSATIGTINITVSPTNSNLFTPSSSTLGHVNSLWMVGGLSDTDSTTGLKFYGYVKITDVINSYTVTATVIKALKATTATSNWAEGAWNSVRGYPSCVSMHERRLWFARTNFEPAKVWGSKTFEYDNFALDTGDDADGLNLALASNESNEIQWLTSGKSLIPGTYGGAFVINSTSTDPITPANATASEEIGFGVSSVLPRKIGNFIYYLQKFGQKLRELFYVWDLDTYKAVDRTILAPHIFGDGVREMDVQHNPESILYCVRTDGTLATMTRELDQDVTAWSRQTTDGTFSSIAIIPSQTYLYDEVWVIVDRWINGSKSKCIEVFDSIVPPARQDLMNYLHCSLLYNAYTAPTAAANTITISGTSGTVMVTASGSSFVAGQVGNRIRAIDANGVTLGEGKITSFTSSTVVNILVKKAFSTTSYAVNRWAVSVTSVSGINHLEAKTVRVLADGGLDAPDKTVSSGTISLAYDYFVVNVGLPYTQTLRLLPKELASARGTAQGKKQRINEVSFKVYRSHKGFYVGGTVDMLERVNFRDPATLMGTPEQLFSGMIPNVSFRDDVQYGSEIYIQNKDPLPVEFLSVMGALETFDK